MKLTDLLVALPFYTVDKKIGDIEIEAIEDDSRFVSDNALFVCLEGYQTDGHDFAGEAAERGAVAVLAQRSVKTSVPVIGVDETSRAMAMMAAHFYNYPTSHLPVIGVTGTNGKTTVTYLLEAIFSEYGMKTGIIGTNQLKVGTDSFPINNTTPNALFLQKSFDNMQRNGVDIVIMEVSSHALDMGRVHGTSFAAAVFTNLSRDHLDYHHTMADYRHAKSLLFAQLGNDYGVSSHPIAILNKDDEAFSVMNKSTSRPVLTYSRKTSAHLQADNITLANSGTTFDLQVGRYRTIIDSCLIGEFNVSNMLAAIGAARVFEVPFAIIQRSLAKIEGISGRFEQVTMDEPYSVIVDYAHTPDSLKNVLKTLQQLAKSRIIAVVGCGGDRDDLKRPLMAQAALMYADWCFFTSDNPRMEDPNTILADMTSELASEGHYSIIVDREQAIIKAINMATAGDVVLIAGKGHEMYQEIGHVKYPFDDRQVARKAIFNKET